MRKEIIDKLDEITFIIDNDKDMILLKELKNKIENNQELLNKISKLKDINKYDNNYLELKKEILDNPDYKEFIKLENELYFLIHDINNKLNTLKEKGGCN